MRRTEGMRHLLWFLVALAAARILPNLQTPTHKILLSRQSQLSALCQAQCDFGSCGGSCSSSRSQTPPRGGDNFQRRDAVSQKNRTGLLYKRVFNYEAGDQSYFDDTPPTGDEADDYFLDVFNGHEDSYYGETLPTVTNYDEAAYSQQVAFGNNPFQILYSGLYGCTVAILVSKRAVWSAHFWQTYSNGPFNTDGRHDTVGDLIFQQRVLDHISGVAVDLPAVPLAFDKFEFDFWSDPDNQLSFPYFTPVGPSVDPSLFPTGETILYLMSPVYPNTELKNREFLYLNRMKEIVKRFSDHLGYKPRCTAVPYAPRRRNDRNLKVSDGKALFQFDPNCDANGNPGYRILFERRLVPPFGTG